MAQKQLINTTESNGQTNHNNLQHFKMTQQRLFFTTRKTFRSEKKSMAGSITRLTNYSWIDTISNSVQPRANIHRRIRLTPRKVIYFTTKHPGEEQYFLTPVSKLFRVRPFLVFTIFINISFGFFDFVLFVLILDIHKLNWWNFVRLYHWKEDSFGIPLMILVVYWWILIEKVSF